MIPHGRLRSEDVHTDDIEIYEQLGKLQGMYEQIDSLRVLLPDGLVNPTRLAGCRSPEKLASSLKDAATTGSTRIKTFKRAYHSDEMRNLWQTVNVSQFPQGQDVWLVDYSASLQDLKRGRGVAVDDSEKPTATGGSTDLDAIINTFKEAHTTIQVNQTTTSSALPLELGISSMKFRIIVPNPTTEGPQAFTVSSLGEIGESATQTEIIRHINRFHKDANLPELLSLLASYDGLEAIACHRCKTIFNGNLELPLLRDKIESKDAWSGIAWRALHSSCS